MMLAHYRRVTEADLEEIRASRKTQENLIYTSRIDSPYGSYLFIGEYWQVINFLLVGQESPELDSLKKVVFATRPLIDGEEIWFDFGPIRYLFPDEVREISNFLNEISSETLLLRYNPAILMEYQIHPDIWWVQEQDKTIRSIRKYYTDLVYFFQEAARSENYILTYVTA